MLHVNVLSITHQCLPLQLPWGSGSTRQFGTHTHTHTHGVFVVTCVKGHHYTSIYMCTTLIRLRACLHIQYHTKYYNGCTYIWNTKYIIWKDAYQAGGIRVLVDVSLHLTLSLTAVPYLRDVERSRKYARNRCAGAPQKKKNRTAPTGGRGAGGGGVEV